MDLKGNNRKDMNGSLRDAVLFVNNTASRWQITSK